MPSGPVLPEGESPESVAGGAAGGGRVEPGGVPGVGGVAGLGSGPEAQV
jgi:hypothetical protein